MCICKLIYNLCMAKRINCWNWFHTSPKSMTAMDQTWDQNHFHWRLVSRNSTRKIIISDFKGRMSFDYSNKSTVLLHNKSCFGHLKHRVQQSAALNSPNRLYLNKQTQRCAPLTDPASGRTEQMSVRQTTNYIGPDELLQLKGDKKSRCIRNTPRLREEWDNNWLDA
jgi:hypothetical protein